MEIVKPDWKHIRNLLKQKDYEALSKLEPHIFQYVEHNLNLFIQSGRSVAGVFAENWLLLDNEEKKSPNDPLRPYGKEVLRRLMPTYNLIFIENYKWLKAGDSAIIRRDKYETECAVDVLEKKPKSTYDMCYSHIPQTQAIFNQKCKPDNFRFAIRQLPSFRLKLANPHYSYFFFNS